MSRVRNADDFLLQYRKICNKYEQIFGPRLAEVRRIYAATPAGALSAANKENLEAHGRVYLVNSLLAALNWRLDSRPEEGLANLIPEAPIRSEDRGSVRFLDYLGLESETDNPLLIVETKRPSAWLPQAFRPSYTYAEVVSVGLADEPLKGEWNKWLADLKDYVCSVQCRTGNVPRRVVLTNGDWLILFLDPSDAFLKDGSHDPNRVVVFESRNHIEKRSGELFEYLEHQHVLGETGPLTAGELPFHLAAESIEYAMHGLLLRYVEQPGVYRPAPVVKMAPVVLLRSRYGAWFGVEAPPKEYELPHQDIDLTRHLTEVQQAAGQLLTKVNSQLARSLYPLPLSKHYQDEEAFAAIPGVKECRRGEFLVATGDKTHYLLPEPSVPDCPYHDWAVCNRAGVPSNPGPISVRSILPRSFFVSTEPHHCAHGDVRFAKASPVSADNRDRCGSRSGKDGQAFCEIWRFEQHLCCRACAFEEVCTQTTVFRLPCVRADQAAATT